MVSTWMVLWSIECDVISVRRSTSIVIRTARDVYLGATPHNLVRCRLCCPGNGCVAPVLESLFCVFDWSDWVFYGLLCHLW